MQILKIKKKAMKNFLLILSFLFTGFTSFAQQPDAATKREKIQALKIAFITQKLELTSDEAQRFWPVYNRYEAELHQTMQDNKGGDVIDNEEKMLNIRKKYRTEFSKVLGQPKMNKLFATEKEFRGVLMRQLKERRNQNKPGNFKKQR
jgi:hypothetical protein